MKQVYSYQDTEAFYDAEDAFYRSFWDNEGSLHWGVFDESTGPDFLKACGNLNQMMAAKAGISGRSNVLDLGCGNGAVASWLARTFNCHVTGIDLSGVRIENAEERRRQQTPAVGDLLSFCKASAIDLPYSDGCFSHVWSQAVVYHVHDKEKALSEAHRVLESRGRFVFDDLFKPKPNISEEAQSFVYDRLMFDTDFSFKSYRTALVDTGFKVLEAHDISKHLKTSYERLAVITEERINGAGSGKYRDLTVAYRKMARAVEREELGWGLYVCEK
jgi:ubiquinone/menaquinone biosynthesis C-methylase UbiE